MSRRWWRSRQRASRPGGGVSRGVRKEGGRPSAGEERAERAITYLSNATDVLVTVLLRKAQVLVQPEAHIVAVEPVGRQADVKQVLLEGRRNR